MEEKVMRRPWHLAENTIIDAFIQRMVQTWSQKMLC